jgi:mono/diheme cytochrome c family protein
LQEPVLTRAVALGRPAVVVQSRAIDETIMSSRRWLNFSRRAARTTFITTTRSGLGVSQPTARRPTQMHELRVTTFAVLALAHATPAQAQSPYGIRRAATPEEVAGWNIDVAGDGSSLPPGSGSVSRGHQVFDQQCAACHGAKGEGGVGDRLAGGPGSAERGRSANTCGYGFRRSPR